jgi:hypothetical protein
MSKLNARYEELWMPVGAGMPNFPETCPSCTSSVKKDMDHFHGPTYECGGQYRNKPQIQCHTNKYWGHCPKMAMAKLEATNLLEASATIWVVKENGERWHVGSFSMSHIAEGVARDLSENYPRFWDDDFKVEYIEILGTVGFGSDGQRYKKGELIALKSNPHHIKGASYERVWFKVTQKSLGSYQNGEILDEVA